MTSSSHFNIKSFLERGIYCLMPGQEERVGSRPADDTQCTSPDSANTSRELSLGSTLYMQTGMSGRTVVAKGWGEGS